MPRLKLSTLKPTRRDMSELHTALKQLGLDVPAEEVAASEMGPGTLGALATFQQRERLADTAMLDAATLEGINRALDHRFYTKSKTRTEHIHTLLSRLELSVDDAERTRRAFGKSTEAAVREFQRREGLPADGRLTDDVAGRMEQTALRQRLSTKTQIGLLQRKLARATRIAKLDVRIDSAELQRKESGRTTKTAIEAFQRKYNLPPTGTIDVATMERLESVAASRPQPTRTLRPRSAAELRAIDKPLRLNMTNQHVRQLQATLAVLGQTIDQKEFNTTTYGATTRQAVVAYQTQMNLPVTGHVDGETLHSLNRAIGQLNPQALRTQFPHRLRGAVRDGLWRGRSGVRVQVWEKPLRGAGTLLAERPTQADGFYDVPYEPPRSPSDNQVKSPFHLLIRVVDARNAVLDSKVLFNPTLIAWVNFTQGADPYRGSSEFERRMRAVVGVLNGVGLTSVVEDDEVQEVTHLAVNTGLMTDDVMQLILAHRAAADLNNATIGPEVFYAYFRQNLPPSLPGDLLGATEAWTLIDQLVDQAVSGVVFMEADLLTQAFDNAVTENLIPRSTASSRDAILAVLGIVKQTFVLEKPILIGSGSFGDVLNASIVPAGVHASLANAFIEHKGLTQEFWTDINAHAAQFGGEAAVADLETTAYVAHIAKHHGPTVSLLKEVIASPLEPSIHSARDLAKFSHSDFVTRLTENGGVVPEGTDGATPEEKINVFAAMLAAQSERLFPTTAFVAEVARSDQHQLTRVADVQQALDAQPELDLATANLGRLAVDASVAAPEEVLAEARVLQRVRRIAPTATLGRVLLDSRIHSSAQIVSMGKERVVETLKAGGVDERTSLTLCSLAEFQYAQALTRLSEFRAELHRDTPQAIVRHTYTLEEQEQLAGTIPDLEMLFGSLDFCDCKHCQSVLGPAAYLADVLRFLGSHRSEQGNRTVRDVLFDRRPDIGNIKLNCENTETPVPYVDLVCEILEHAIPAPTARPNFSFQTTLSREELRAFPQHVRRTAYDVLRRADFPMDSSFDLWQEEARGFLKHLGISRWELMEAFQSRPAAGDANPSDVSIAGEYWHISSHETDIIVTAAASQADQDRFWGFDSTRPQASVAEILDHAQLDYRQLLELLLVRWLNPPDAADRMIINRPVVSASLDRQMLTELTFDRLDRMHRFVRLWRHTPWKIWELDLLLRAATVGHGSLNAATLVRLQHFHQLQEKLRLGVEEVLIVVGTLNTEGRQRPDQPQRVSPSIYDRFFQNPAITTPVPADFSLPLAAGQQLSSHQATLLAALQISERDLRLLLRTLGSDDLTVANLAVLLNHAMLARATQLRIEELVPLLDLAGVSLPFATPREALDFIETHDRVRSSGFGVRELEYLLMFSPDSAFGLRDEVVTQQVEALRESLRTTPPANARGQIIANVAASFAVSEEQMRLLLNTLDLNGTLIGHLENPQLTARDVLDRYITPISLANFPRIYESYRLLHKAAMLITRHRIIESRLLEWLLTNHHKLQLLNFSALPVSAAPAQSLFESWLRTFLTLEFRAAFPEPEDTSFTAVIDLAANPANAVDNVLTSLAALTTWKQTDLNALHAELQLQHGADSDYTNIETYAMLARCFRMLKRIGVDAPQVVQWARRDVEAGEAQFNTALHVRQTAKSKHDQIAWLKIVAPLQDDLRARKRQALVRHLVAHSTRTEPSQIAFAGKQYANSRRWRDARDLLGYFLIDVEMEPCQLTSRIKQAISSVQMFVQRAFLNLEQPFVEVSRQELQDGVSLNSWKQWKWMKSYRIWEANRKVFLYPENWLEPELRDDKSPFFEDLENELAQHDLTHAHAENAFRHYMEKVHEVAHLEVVGVYHEVDDDKPYDNLPPNINQLHVIGRTKSDPAQYYYRRYDLTYSTWTAWVKVDVDISGDHVVPVVYNRKLHLFWLTFLEKPQKLAKQPPAKASRDGLPQDTPEAPTQLELQLAWSVKEGSGWTAKRQSRNSLIHPWQRPLHSYNLKPRYKARENQLWLDVYISTSAAFNDALFYDPYVDARRRATAFVYDETARPWHSSSFVFDGDVLDVKLKPLAGHYRIRLGSGQLSSTPLPTTSYHFVRDAFGEAGAAIKPLSGGYEIAPRLALPDGMHFENTRLTNNTRRPNNSRVNVLERGATRTLLNGGRFPFEIVLSPDDIQHEAISSVPLMYQDGQRAFFAKTQSETLTVGYNQTLQRLRYTFYPFYHPYTGLFLRELNRSGPDGLLTRKIQLTPQSFYPGNAFQFASYAPTSGVAADETAVRDIVDFTQEGAFSVYNWELFFHGPLMVACRLMQNQRFEEAMQWFHYVFDPTNTESLGVPQRYWVTKPFFEQNSDDYRRQRIETLLDNIAADIDQIKAWKNNPFKPHLIARFRPVAYQKAVVMKYLENLIAWGDQLFRRDTIEASNEATTLYVLAYELLGRRPVEVPDVERRDRSYNELIADGALDPFGNRKVEVLMENLATLPVRVVRSDSGTEPMPHLEVSYFSLPRNDKLLEYWDRVEDRLFKIRHCMNLQGMVRQLPLFEPPIDPALLVKAAAAGVDLDSVLTALAPADAQYRFRLLAQKALEICSDVRSLGDKLLGVLEKQDAEGLALLHSTHEIELLTAVKEVRKAQIDEARLTQASLEKGKELAQAKRDYYDTRQFLNTWEDTALSLNGVSALAETAIAVGYALAGGLAVIPSFTVGAAGFGGSPVAEAEPVNGLKFSKAAEAAVATLSAIARAADKLAGLAGTMGGYVRRQEEWTFSADLAAMEVEQLAKQITAAAVRVAIAEKELDNQELQLENARGVDEYLRSKYSNQQLYRWMLTQVATVYFQSYQLAYDMAKRAEQAFRFEFGRPDASFIQFGYWDSLKKGLVAGDRLANDIRRMEAAYLDQNRRRLELVKHVSLMQLDPLSLIVLRQTGACNVTIPEWLFDMDYPGHYRRRIKSVSITIPCVVGPYTGVNCTVSLTNHGTRVKQDTGTAYGDPLAAMDDRFFRSPVPIQSIATSSAQNDAGVFELNFNDERYMPFEGAGAVSEWRIELPKENNQFDLATVADVVMHIRYEAEAGNVALANAARANVNAVLPTSGLRMFSLREEFGSDWYRFLNPVGNADQELMFSLGAQHLPFYARGRAATLTGLELFIGSGHVGKFDLEIQFPGKVPEPSDVAAPDDAINGVHHLVKGAVPPSTSVTGTWRWKIKKDSAMDFKSLQTVDVVDAFLVTRFKLV